METLWQHKNKNLSPQFPGIVKSHELSLCIWDEIKTNLEDQNVMEIQRIQPPAQIEKQ